MSLNQHTGVGNKGVKSSSPVIINSDDDSNVDSDDVYSIADSDNDEDKENESTNNNLPQTKEVLKEEDMKRLNPLLPKNEEDFNKKGLVYDPSIGICQETSPSTATGDGDPYDIKNIETKEEPKHTFLKSIKGNFHKNKRKNFSLEEIDDIWLKFISWFSKEMSEKPQLKSNPYEAELDLIVDFILTLDLSMKLDDNLFLSFFSALQIYHRDKNLISTPALLLNRVRENSTNTTLSLNNKINFNLKYINYWRHFASSCEEGEINPFQASPMDVSNVITTILSGSTDSGLMKSIQNNKSQHASVNKRDYSYFSAFVENYCYSLDLYLEVSLIDGSILQTVPIKKLLAAAKACDEKLTNNPKAYELLPYYHYLQVMKRSRSDYKFWNSKIVDNVIKDVKNGNLNVNVAAKELGITTEMLNSEIALKNYPQCDDDDLPSLNEYVTNRSGGENRFWRNGRIRDYLDLVKERKISVEEAAAYFGVSRKMVDEKCGGIKSEEDLNAEKESKRIQRIEQQEEAAKKRMKVTHLDKQIKYDEENEDDLCEYEKHRLANLRERKALMEQLNIMGDKLEIREMNKAKKVAAAYVEKDELPKREKSSRIKKQNDLKRLKLSSTGSPTNEVRRCFHAPSNFGGLVVFSRMDLSSFRKHNPVPKFDFESRRLLEVTGDIQYSARFLDSISHECEDLTCEDDWRQEVDWRLFDNSSEYIVSSCPITVIDSFGDFISYGTKEGGVGVLMGGRSVTLRPHSEAVTGLIMNGSKILSCSFDGTVRRWDLKKQMVTLEYSWERSSDIKHGVRGLVRSSASSYIVDCDSSFRILDIREKAATILCNSEPASVADHMSHIAIEPQNKDLFSACRDEIVRIFDLRNCSEPLWSFNGHDFSFAGWNENGREFSVVDIGNSSVFSVNAGIPTGRHKRSIPGSALPSLRGDIWCSWQSSVHFNIRKSKDNSIISAVSSTTGDVIDDLEIETMNQGEVIVHCHATRPQLVLGNSDGMGRLRIVSSQFGEAE